MKITNLVTAVAVALIAFSGFANAQKGNVQVKEITQPAVAYFGGLNLSPVEGNAYTIIHGLGVENPIDGTAGGFFFGINADPNTGAVNDAIMDDQADLIGVDLADVFGFAAPNEVVATECLESLGMDAGTGRFMLRLTLANESMASELQWDTLDMDLFDPGDADLDGETGAGPDGMFGTADDVVEPDGVFDTGDGVLDSPFPLTPFGLVFLIDLDMDGDPNNDPPSPAVSAGLFIGANAGGTAVPFDAAAGEVTVTAANWELRDFDGELADVFLDGGPDGPFDVSGFATFNPPLGGGWFGDFGVGFGVDGNTATVFGSVGANIKTNQLVVDYLSDIDNEFCFMPGGDVLLGDVNLDGVVDLLDVAPFVNLITTTTFQAEGDINMDGNVDLLDVALFVAILTGG